MAKKSRFFHVKIRNGHGPCGDWIVPAQKGSQAESYFASHDIAVYECKHLGQVDVETYPDESKGVIFYATIGKHTYEYSHRDAGYEWLKLLFSSQYQSALSDLDY